MGEAYLCGSGGGSAGCVIGVTFPSTCNCTCQRKDIDSKIYMAPSLSEDDLAKEEYSRYWAFSLPPHTTETEYLVKIIYIKDGTRTAETTVKIKKNEYKRIDLILSKVFYDAVNNILPDTAYLFSSTLNSSEYQVSADFGSANSGISISNSYHGASDTGQVGQTVFTRQINATSITQPMKLKNVKTIEVTLGSYHMEEPTTSYLAIIISQPPPSGYDRMNAKSTLVIRDANNVIDSGINGTLTSPKIYSIDVSNYDIPTSPSDNFYIGIASAAGIPGYGENGPYTKPNPTRCLLQKVELKY